MSIACRTFTIALVAASALVAVVTQADAVPIFAERYNFKCTQCHTAVPELNAFGDAFRKAGYRLANVPKHAEFPLAVRFQETYVKDLLPAEKRRFNALGILISTANFGPEGNESFFARYLLGSQGAAGSLFFAWAQHVDPKDGTFERVGLFSLPLIADPAQRLDTITPQPVYTYTVGHNSANFSTPRLGALFGQRNDRLDVEIAISGDEYHGAAYGAPAPPSDFTQTFEQPEVFATATLPVGSGARAGGLFMEGTRRVMLRSTGTSFTNSYRRQGIQGSWTWRRFDLAAQQIWGRDSNSDGFGTQQGSSGGFATLKYRPTKHAYIAARYDAAANPFASRDWDYYAVWAPTIHARAVVEYTRPQGAGQKSTTRAQLLFAVPFERKGAAGP